MNDPVALLLGSGGGAALIYACVALVKAVLSRKVVNADAATRLAGSSVQIIEAVRADAAGAILQARTDAATAILQARTDAAASVAMALQDVAAARRDAAEARREASDARKEAESSNLLMRKLIGELFRPDTTVERLRRLVGDNGGSPAGAINGAH